MRAAPLLLLSVLATTCGCAAVVVGAAGGVATAKWISNQSVRDYRAPLPTVYDAVLASLPELGWPAPSKAVQGPTEARVEAGDMDVALAQHPQGVVRVAVRVGTFESADHRRRADLLHERLAARLGPAAVVPPS